MLLVISLLLVCKEVTLILVRQVRGIPFTLFSLVVNFLCVEDNECPKVNVNSSAYVVSVS